MAASVHVKGQTHAPMPAVQEREKLLPPSLQKSVGSVFVILDPRSSARIGFIRLMTLDNDDPGMASYMFRKRNEIRR